MTDRDPVPSAGQGVDPLVGKVLSDRYELTALIARGGMGKIYKAVQRPLGRSVALKVLDAHDSDREFRDRFFLEASLCARLSHPNTVRIYDYGTTADGIFYIAMEFLEGEALQDLLVRDAPLDPLRALRIVRQVCGALGEAHDCGIVHRDLKPGNVFLTPFGDDREFVKVLDFGLVKELGKESELSRTGSVLGSPLYISPEQVQGSPVDQRADIYATGLIVYYMLTGRTAFKKGNALSLLMMHTTAAPPSFAEANPEVRLPAALEWVVQRCLEKQPEDRFGSMHELLRAVKACEKELRGEIGTPLRLELHGGMIVLPEGLEISSEIRLPEGPRPTPAPDPNTTLVTTTRPMRMGLVVLVGTITAGLGFAVLIGVVLVAIVGGTLATQPVAEPAPDVAPAVAPAAPSAPSGVEVLLATEPPGAEVIDSAGVLLGTTPLARRLAPGTELVVTLRKTGYEDRKVALTPDAPTVSVPLSPKRTSPRPRPSAEPAPVAAPEPPAPAPEPEPPRPRLGGDLKGWDE